LRFENIIELYHFELCLQKNFELFTQPDFFSSSSVFALALKGLLRRFGLNVDIFYYILYEKKSRPGVNFINILRAAFWYESFAQSFFVVEV
jgi:hypothetical protein